MEMKKYYQLECAKFSMELRSGKIISAGEGFTEMFGYTKEDIADGINYSDLLPCFEEKEIVTKLREIFAFSSNCCFEHTIMCKDGSIKSLCSMIEIQNKLLNGHRVLDVKSTDLDKIIELDRVAVKK